MKIALFTEPNSIVSQFLAQWKEEVWNVFGDQPYLSHPPHSTLFTLDIDKDSENWITFEESGFHLPLTFSPFDIDFIEPFIFLTTP